MIKGKETVRNFIKPHFWRSCVCSSRVSHGRSHTALPWSIFHKTHECREICRAKDAQSYHEKGRFLKSPAASLTTFDRRICQLRRKKIAKCLLFFSAKTRMSTRKHQSHCAAARRFDHPFPWTKVGTKKPMAKAQLQWPTQQKSRFPPGKIQLLLRKFASFLRDKICNAPKRPTRAFCLRAEGCENAPCYPHCHCPQLPRRFHGTLTWQPCPKLEDPKSKEKLTQNSDVSPAEAPQGHHTGATG